MRQRFGMGKSTFFSTERLYCFGKKGKNSGLPKPIPTEPRPTPGVTTALQILPSEVLLKPGQKAKFTVRGIDANGLVTEKFDSKQAKWTRYIPPTARVKSELNANVNENGELVASDSLIPSAGAFLAEIGKLRGTMRGRILPAPPQKEDFEAFKIDTKHATEPNTMFAYPPLPWIGARFKFEVRELEGQKVFAKTLDNIFFQRATVFIGNANEKNYTIEADVRMDGNRRTISSVGLINQRYLITMEGNAQTLQISSNQERIRVTVPFKIAPKAWYHLKTRVDVAKDGSGVVRAKAWAKGEAEPSGWNIEVPHKSAHRNGSPGLFGFSPQSLFRCYIDNIAITPN